MATSAQRGGCNSETKAQRHLDPRRCCVFAFQPSGRSTGSDLSCLGRSPCTQERPFRQGRDRLKRSSIDTTKTRLTFSWSLLSVPAGPCTTVRTKPHVKLGKRGRMRGGNSANRTTMHLGFVFVVAVRLPPEQTRALLGLRRGRQNIANQSVKGRIRAERREGLHCDTRVLVESCTPPSRRLMSASSRSTNCCHAETTKRVDMRQRPMTHSTLQGAHGERDEGHVSVPSR